MKRGQTATEYLVITAVVIIIAVLVVNILGGIPGLGSGASKQTNDVQLGSLQIGVRDYAISDYDTVFTLVNNAANNIRIRTITLDGIICAGFHNYLLSSGKQIQVSCGNIFEANSDSVEYELVINYTDLKTGALYSQSETDVTLIGNQVATKWESILSSTSSYNGSGGCWNWTTVGDTGAICTCLDLARINDNTSTLQSNFILLNNIDMQRCADTFGGTAVALAANWTPIGSPSAKYTGVFSGNGNVISGITISGGSDLGLFGHVGPGGIIEDISLYNTTVVGGDRVGALAGTVEVGMIENVNVYGIVSGGNSVGGLFGSDFATVTTIKNVLALVLASCSDVYCGAIQGVYAGANYEGKNFWDPASSGDPGACAGTLASAPAGFNDSNCFVFTP